ncbi:MAG: SAP domain-containing protein [Thermoplasmata archaeon]|nr:SAP domain-containing protein [Thermoplasmata archaeon]
MSLAYDLLDRYLYKEDLQQLARDRGLPTNRSKDDLIRLLLGSGRFVPAEALRYLNRRELRRICQEYLLPDEGTREILFQRVLTAIFAEVKSEPAPDNDSADEDAEEVDSGDRDEEEDHLDMEAEPEPAPLSAPKTPRTGGAPDRETAEPRPTVGFLQVPPDVWAAAVGRFSYAPARDVSREHPDTTASWAVASIVAGGVVIAGFYLFISALGLLAGVAAGIVLALGVAAALLLTWRQWVPWLARFG